MKRQVVLVGVSFLLVGLLASPATAAPPVNDDFADAKVIGRLPYADSLKTNEATRGEGDSGCGFRPRRTVWYSYTPPSDRWVLMDTVGSRYHTVLTVSTGPSDNPARVACAHHNAKRGTSRVVVELTGGDYLQRHGGGRAA